MSRLNFHYKNIKGDDLLTRIGVIAGFLYPVLEYLYTSNVNYNSMWITLGLIITGALSGREPKLKNQDKVK